jgi:hypothetical protein
MGELIEFLLLRALTTVFDLVEGLVNRVGAEEGVKTILSNRSGGYPNFGSYKIRRFRY